MSLIKKLLILGLSFTFISPIIGVGGTVVGMFNAFNTIEKLNGTDKAAALAESVSFALYTTVAGFLFSIVGLTLLVICLVKYLNEKKQTSDPWSVSFVDE
ncbi:MAG: MotA/TolQ/ExbB proton channel family protein [Lentisphaeria bacterium]|nr:MotA/TolQ/ExbB proton channel family protein [Lentisphaeria bacterium]